MATTMLFPRMRPAARGAAAFALALLPALAARASESPVAFVEPAAVAAPPAVAASQPVPRLDAKPEAQGTSHPWPGDVRVRYTGRAHFHADFPPQAELQWKLDGARYAMRLDMGLGVLQRRSSSQGQLGVQGLEPERYEESNRPVLGRQRGAALQLDGPSIELADGQREARPAGVQDPVSQFGQLARLFAVAPAGKARAEFPLALPKRVSAYAYEIQGRETLDTPMGKVEAVHLKPQRVDGKDSKDTAAEVWLAPKLNYLPVRIRIAQDDGASVDLLIAQPPEPAR